MCSEDSMTFTRSVIAKSTADKYKRLNASEHLKKCTTQRKQISPTWFSDEKIFTVETPSNSQNDHVYARVRMWCVNKSKHFMTSIMVSVAVSKLGKTPLVLVQPAAKNKAHITVINFTFQQDGAQSHRSDLCTRSPSCRQMSVTSLSRQTRRLTHLIWIQ